MKIKTFEGNVTFPKGFLAAGLNCGLRIKKPDLALIYSVKKCIAVGAFTRNKFQAAPIIVSKENIKNPIQAIIVNSSNANAGTGEKGIEDAKKMCSITSSFLNINEKNVLVFSTGVIGKFLDMKKIEKGIKTLIPLLSNRYNQTVSSAILTTDKMIKECAVEFNIKNKKVRIGSIAKGSGMIEPNMATMLCFITSDVNIKKSVLKKLFLNAIENSFNLITIDGDMSTNDAVVMLANGMAENNIIDKTNSKEAKIFYENLLFVMKRIAYLIVKDGEGVTKVIEIIVKNCSTKEKARIIGKRIANSMLVKTAIYGEDANWGRVLAALGSTLQNFDRKKVVIKFGNYIMFKNEKPVKFDEIALKNYLKNNEIKITVDLNEGKESISILTGDLTEEYIRINAKYRS